MKPPFSYVPLLPVFVAQATGVMICSWLDSVYVGLALMIFSIFFLLMKKYYSVVLTSAILIGWCCCYLNLNEIDRPDYLTDGTVLEATVESIAETSRGRAIYVKADKRMLADSSFIRVAPVGIRLSVASLFPDIASGDRIVFKGDYSSIHTMTDLPDEFDMSKFLIQKGISAVSFVKPEEIKVTGRATGVIWWLKRYQAKVVDRIYCSGFNDATSDFICAAVAGDRSSIDSETKKKFSSTGQAHILALSGTHVVIIASIVSIVLFPLTFFGFHKCRLVLIIFVLWIFAIVTGLMPSVTRSVIMTTIVIGAYLLKRHNSSMNALFAAAILIMTFDPCAIFQIGFQLSFVSVASILLLVEKLNPVPQKYHCLHGISAVIILPCVAVLGTIALSMYYFHIFPVYFILAAVPVSFLFTLVISGGIVVILFETVGIPHCWINSVVEYLYSSAMKIMDMTMNLPYAVVDRIYLDEMTVAVAMCIPLALAGWLTYRRQVWGIGCIVLAMAAVSVQYLSVEDYPHCEMFITRETLNTNIIIRDGKKMLLVSTVNPTMLGDEIAKCNFKYADYMGMRGVDSIQAVVDTASAYTNSVSYSGRRLIVGDHSFIIINGDNDLRRPPFKPTYALVCRGFKGDIEDVVKVVSPDVVLLSHDLHRSRHDRYHSELHEMGVNVVSVRENGGFMLSF